MKCKKCKQELGTGETSIEYCDGFCVNCYKNESNENDFKICNENEK